MMKAGGTEIGKTLAEKSRGLFSANDWQCKTYVDCTLEVPYDVVESNLLHLLVLGLNMSLTFLLSPLQVLSKYFHVTDF